MLLLFYLVCAINCKSSMCAINCKCLDKSFANAYYTCEAPGIQAFYRKFSNIFNLAKWGENNFFKNVTQKYYHCSYNSRLCKQFIWAID